MFLPCTCIPLKAGSSSWGGTKIMGQRCRWGRRRQRQRRTRSYFGGLGLAAAGGLQKNIFIMRLYTCRYLPDDGHALAFLRKMLGRGRRTAQIRNPGAHLRRLGDVEAVDFTTKDRTYRSVPFFQGRSVWSRRWKLFWIRPSRLHYVRCTLVLILIRMESEC